MPLADAGPDSSTRQPAPLPVSGDNASDAADPQGDHPRRVGRRQGGTMRAGHRVTVVTKP
jgi:hypothetical protein